MPAVLCTKINTVLFFELTISVTINVLPLSSIFTPQYILCANRGDFLRHLFTVSMILTYLSRGHWRDTAGEGFSCCFTLQLMEVGMGCLSGVRRKHLVALCPSHGSSILGCLAASAGDNPSIAFLKWVPKACWQHQCPKASSLCWFPDFICNVEGSPPSACPHHWC